jgi:homoserine dehydrogenase
MNDKQIYIGLFGFGTVGKGLYDVLKKIDPDNVHLVKVCVRNVAKHQHLTSSSHTPKFASE